MTPIQKAMLQAGLIEEDDLPSRTVEPQVREPGELPRVPWEAPPSGRVVEGPREMRAGNPAVRILRCGSCGCLVDDWECPCGGEVSEIKDVPRKTGHMVWTHKTAPVFQFDNSPTMTPEDYASGRRR